MLDFLILGNHKGPERTRTQWFYTVRYREKDKDKKWVFQLCPVTETVVDNLKPNTVYEFGVKDNVEDSIWSKTFNHKTVLSIIQNRTQSKTSDSSSLPGAILVHLIVPGLNETQQKLPPLLTIDDIPQASRKKLAKNETQVWPAESKTPEVQEISPQSLPASHDFLHVTSTPKTSTSAKMSEQETVTIQAPFKPVTSDNSEVELAPKPPLLEPKTSQTVEQPKAILAFMFVSDTVLEPITRRTDQLKPTIVPKETQRVPSKPRTSPSSEVPQTKPVLEPITFRTEKPKSTAAPKDTHPGPSKPKTSPSSRIPPTRASPKESRRVSSKPRPSPSPDVPRTKPAPKEPQHTPFKPKVSPIPDAPHSKPAPTEKQFIHTKPKTSQKPRVPHTKPAIHQTTPQPIITKSSTTTEHSRATMAPKETLLIPSKPKTSVGPEVPQTKPVPNETYQISPKPKTVLATEIPRFKTALSKTTLAPARTKAPGLPKWIVPTTDDVYTPEDIARQIGVDVEKPLEYSDTWEKPISAPHVKYMKKDDDVPCSITSSLEHFPQEEAGSKEEPIRPPQNPPTNLTVVTVEGCPTFVILDWEKPDNDTVTEYEVVSTENGASDGEKEKSIITTNQTHSTVENLKPDTSYEFHVKPRNPLGEGPSSNVVTFSTESVGKDAIWTEIPFNSDTYSECKGKQYVKRTWYKKFVGVQLCNSLRYKIYLSDSLTGKFYNIGDQRGHGEDHCQFVDSFLDGRTGQQDDLPVKDGFFRAVRQEPVKFGKIGGETHINYVRWYECGTSIPGKW
ncbi:target of Nesh-SH3 [Grus japonensis]|uniref:Target of Nesh-SH3 n=1 Tax=Grus japonensis TaxID=30415 RepID=A0ABC9VWZ9_GRUJA